MDPINKCLDFELLYSLLPHLQTLPHPLDDPTLETIKKRIEDHNVPEV
jgi:hypothetical protein